MTDFEDNIQNAGLDRNVSDMSGGMVACLDKFSRTFEASARRWELVVYPSLLAFIVLAAYGFFLIYTLANDVGRMARSIETMVVSMDDVARVGVLNRLGDRPDQLCGPLAVDWSIFDQFGKRAAFDQSHRKEVLVTMLTDFVDRDDAGMVELGS